MSEFILNRSRPEAGDEPVSEKEVTLFSSGKKIKKSVKKTP